MVLLRRGISKTLLVFTFDGGLNGAADTLLLSLTSALFQSLENSGQDEDLTGGVTGT